MIPCRGFLLFSRATPRQDIIEEVQGWVEFRLLLFGRNKHRLGHTGFALINKREVVPVERAVGLQRGHQNLLYCRNRFLRLRRTLNSDFLFPFTPRSKLLSSFALPLRSLFTLPLRIPPSHLAGCLLLQQADIRGSDTTQQIESVVANVNVTSLSSCHRLPLFRIFSAAPTVLPMRA